MASYFRISRYLRLYQKKRGERRTGSEKAGSAGLTLFFGGMLVLGVCVFGVILTMLAWPEWRANQQFQKAQCWIIYGRPEEVTLAGRTVYRPRFLVDYYPEGVPLKPLAAWDIAGTSFSREECREIIEEYPRHSRQDCWYDRDNPATVVLVRGYSSHVWLVLLLPGAFILVGGVGLAYRLASWRMSAEHRKYWARRAAAIAPKDVTFSGGEYPTIPRSNVTDSPGTRLAYRLPLAVSGGWALFSMVAGSLIFGCMVSVFITWAAVDAWHGEVEWLLIVVSVLFAPLAGWLLWYCLRRLARSVHLGRTLAEVSAHPLRPGETCRVFLAQFGRMRLLRLRLTLVCVERATYQQGTNTRSETREVLHQTIFTSRDIAIGPESPLEIEQELMLSEGVMHSFRSPGNEVAWMLVVEGQPRRWSRFRRAFPVIVYPPRGGDV